MFKNKTSLRGFCLLFIACCLLPACAHIDLYEKVVAVPNHQWQSGFKPTFAFNIKDTGVPYQLYFIVRHSNQYKYNNVWVNLTAKGPSDSAQTFKLELPLANKDGWLGAGMDDVYEHRIGFVLDPQKFSFARSGNYNFTVEQIMREDPLPNVMDVGLRLEKKTQ